MPGRGPAPKPKAQRRTAHKPQRGEWQATPGVGWQHGPVPDPPAGLHVASVRAWEIWFRSWWAAHWTPSDVPGLEVLIGLHSEVRTALEEPFVEGIDEKTGRSIYVRRPNPTTELRQMMDNYGVTPKGQQDRRWTRPEPEKSAAETPAAETSGHYGHLRVAK
jgi:hypothetical protein